MAFKPTPNTEYRNGDIIVDSKGEALLLLNDGKCWVNITEKSTFRHSQTGFEGFGSPRKQVLNIFDIPREFWAKLANEE